MTHSLDSKVLLLSKKLARAQLDRNSRPHLNAPLVKLRTAISLLFLHESSCLFIKTLSIFRCAGHGAKIPLVLLFHNTLLATTPARTFERPEHELLANKHYWCLVLSSGGPHGVRGGHGREYSAGGDMGTCEVSLIVCCTQPSFALGAFYVHLYILVSLLRLFCDAWTIPMPHKSPLYTTHWFSLDQ
ncbi:hypothetical protein K474DRAFT_1029658 [Panus rudis PR-1116 ss-1]|nr:hypothetical protein K474DRAFT_1029658 [Panus rudis PR-1116 ss-1]